MKEAARSPIRAVVAAAAEEEAVVEEAEVVAEVVGPDQGPDQGLDQGLDWGPGLDRGPDRDLGPGLGRAEDPEAEARGKERLCLEEAAWSHRRREPEGGWFEPGASGFYGIYWLDRLRDGLRGRWRLRTRRARSENRPAHSRW